MAIYEDRQRIAYQVWNATVSQVRRAPVVAGIWKAHLQAGAVTLAQTNARITDGCASFLDTIARLNAAAQDPVKGPLVDAAIAFITNGEHTTQQVRNFMVNVRNAVIALRDADRSTQQLCIAALDTFIADIPSIPDAAGTISIFD